MCVFVKAIDSLSSPPRKPIAEKDYLPVQIMGLEAYLMPDYIIMKTQKSIQYATDRHNRTVNRILGNSLVFAHPENQITEKIDFIYYAVVGLRIIAPS